MLQKKKIKITFFIKKTLQNFLLLKLNRKRFTSRNSETPLLIKNSNRTRFSNTYVLPENSQKQDTVARYHQVCVGVFHHSPLPPRDVSKTLRLQWLPLQKEQTIPYTVYFVSRGRGSHPLCTLTIVLSCIKFSYIFISEKGLIIKKNSYIYHK